MTVIPTDPTALDHLAAEYVLGTLDARTARAVADAVPGNVGLAALVMEWEAIFAPLLALMPPESAPEGLWTRIEQKISPQAVVPAPARPRGLSLWRGWAIGASLVAAGLAALIVLPKPPEQRMMTVLVSDATQTAWTAEVDSKGGLQLAALPAAGGAANNTSPDGDRVLQLWALAPGATAPVSLGLVPRGSGRVNIPAPAINPVPGMLIEISLEPPGGSPGARPTGPVLFIGRLSQAGPRT